MKIARARLPESMQLVTLIDEWNDKGRNGETVPAHFENVVDGPKYIDQYSRPKEDFAGFIEDVTAVEIEYDCKHEAEGYWSCNSQNDSRGAHF